ncbi:hypothetical protein ACF0H5_007920 [Mactra antiquata]
MNIHDLMKYVDYIHEVHDSSIDQVNELKYYILNQHGTYTEYIMEDFENILKMFHEELQEVQDYIIMLDAQSKGTGDVDGEVKEVLVDELTEFGTGFCQSVVDEISCTSDCMFDFVISQKNNILEFTYGQCEDIIRIAKEFVVSLEDNIAKDHAAFRAELNVNFDSNIAKDHTDLKSEFNAENHNKNALKAEFEARKHYNVLDDECKQVINNVISLCDEVSNNVDDTCKHIENLVVEQCKITLDTITEICSLVHELLSNLHCPPKESIHCH